MFAVLKARGWAVELSAGESGMSFSAASLFSVNIVLTDEGALAIARARRHDFATCTADVAARCDVTLEQLASGSRALPADAKQMWLMSGSSSLTLSSEAGLRDCHFFTIAGHARVEEVLALLFDYLAVLGGPAGVSKAVWEEDRALCTMRFDFSERLQPLQAAQSLAHAMHDYADR